MWHCELHIGLSNLKVVLLQPKIDVELLIENRSCSIDPCDHDLWSSDPKINSPLTKDRCMDKFEEDRSRRYQIIVQKLKNYWPTNRQTHRLTCVKQYAISSSKASIKIDNLPSSGSSMVTMAMWGNSMTAATGSVICNVTVSSPSYTLSSRSGSLQCLTACPVMKAF